MILWPYLLCGVFIWIFMHHSGVHSTIAGVLLAFAIPFTHKIEDQHSPSHRLEHALHFPVAFIILPLFALANTGIVLSSNWIQELQITNSIGIIAGLVVGKPLGITLCTLVAIKSGICKLPNKINLLHIIGAGILGGIGYTMSIFITNLSFDNAAIINSSKMAILFASLLSGCLGFLWLRWVVSKE